MNIRPMMRSPEHVPHLLPVRPLCEPELHRDRFSYPSGWRRGAFVLVAAMLCGPVPLQAQPSSDWAEEGALGIEKIVFLRAVTRMLGPGGRIVSNTNRWGIDPLVKASTTEGTSGEKLDAYMLALGQAGLNTVWPYYGLTIRGGQMFIGGALYTIEQMIAGARDQQAWAVLTGDPGLSGGINNPVRQTPFLGLGLNRGITIDTLGQRITTEADLRARWFQAYGAQLRDIWGAGQARAILDTYWPNLLQLWRMQRAEIGMRALGPLLDRAVREGREARARYRLEHPPRMAQAPSKPQVTAQPQVVKTGAINGGGSCTPKTVGGVWGCGPWASAPSTWIFSGAGISGGCARGYSMVSANSPLTYYQCRKN